MVNWNIALDPTAARTTAAATPAPALVTVEPDGTVTTNAEYYTIGHLTKFVKPGAVRIASTSFGTTGWNGQIMDVAFRNPDGSTALVVHNENDDPRTFAVAVGGRSFDYTLPGGALATFTWPRSDLLDDGYDLLALHGATATAVPTGETPQARRGRRRLDPRGPPAPRRHRASSSRSTSAGRQTFRRVVLDTGASTGDYARSWTLQVSDDASRWRTLASGTGTGQLTTVDVPRTHARYLRVVSTGSADNWWSVADLRLYD